VTASEFNRQYLYIVVALTAFAAARPYFAKEIATLQACVQARVLTTNSLLPALTSLTSKLVY
jgi:hypothetical protein